MRSLILGTAGHVDHGKTELIKSLTGVDTDRLPEEKLRGISIDLGFASLVVDDEILIGIVDVPGHEKFIKNMLAGAGGIDFALFVVAADEGIMPQTREHLDIIMLLGVRHAIFAVTKIDLVDKESVEVVTDQIRSLLKETPFFKAPIVAVSAKTGEGIEQMRSEIADLARKINVERNMDVIRLPIDRVFSISGWGTVITGTLWSGIVKVRDHLRILPAGMDVKVRSIEVHGKPTDSAIAGQRTALGLHGVSKDETSRGDCLVSPGDFASSSTLDLDLLILPSVRIPLKSGSRIRFYLGTSEVLGRIVLAGREEIAPGERSLAQIRLESPVVAGFGDRFVLRTYSPMMTIGGGRVLDPIAARRRRRILDEDGVLRCLLNGDEHGALEVYIRQSRGITIDRILLRFNLGRRRTLEVLHQLEKQERVFLLQGDFVVDVDTTREVESRIVSLLESEQAKERLRWGVPIQALRSNLRMIDARLFDWVLDRLLKKGVIRTQKADVRLGSDELELTEDEESAINMIKGVLSKSRLQPPSEAEIESLVKIDHTRFEKLIKILIDKGEIVRLERGLIFDPLAIESAKKMIATHLSENKKATASELKNLLGITRKHAIPLLEHLDRVGFTTRDNEGRRSLVRPISDQ